MPPGRLGRYRVLEVIGTGAFATVVKARDDRLDADVAVKLLAENHSLTPGVRERFVTEGQLLRRARSPNVVAVHDVGETESGQPYLVLDLVSGGDLAARRGSLGSKPVTEQDVATVAGALAAALTALHEVGVVHRDLAPGNLLIASSGATAAPRIGLLATGERVLLTDLGLSKDLVAASGLTVGAGTAGFSPPEQRAGGRVDQRADIWSASALLVWLLLGRTPDEKATWVAEVRRLGWSDAFVGVLRRGLSADPRRRQPTAQTWLDELTDSTTPSPRPGHPQESAPRSRVVGGHPRIWLLLVTLIVLASALVVAGWWTARAGPGVAQHTRALDDGRVQVSAAEDGLRASIIGPARTASGSTARFDAEVQGVDWFWITPDGRRHDGVDSIEVYARSAGLAEITLVGLDEAGRRVVVQHDLEVDTP